MNHAEYKRKARRMSVPELRYTIKDCQEAIAANPEGHKAGHYADEICYCASELHRRDNK